MTDSLTSEKRVWIASKGNEKALRLAESDGWEVHEVAKAPSCRPNSPEDIRQSMELLQQIHRDSLPSNERLMAKVRKAVEYANNGDPIKDAIDPDEIESALRLLVEVWGSTLETTTVKVPFECANPACGCHTVNGNKSP